MNFHRNRNQNIFAETEPKPNRNITVFFLQFFVFKSRETIHVASPSSIFFYENQCLTLFPTKTIYFPEKGFFLHGISFSSSGEKANIGVNARFGFGLPKHRFWRTTEIYRNFGRTLSIIAEPFLAWKGCFCFFSKRHVIARYFCRISALLNIWRLYLRL